MTKKAHYLNVYTFSFWRAYFVQMRPYLLFVSGVAGWAGMSMVMQDPFSLQKSILAFLPMFLGYGFGQALTDCFQMDTDKISAPYRPLSKGIISKQSVMIISMSGLILFSFLLVYLNIWNALFCLLSIIGLSTYSIVKKRFWFGGPFYNAWIVALLPIMGYLSLSGDSLTSLSNQSLQQLLLLSFFSYASFVLIGYLKDINADKETGYKTVPVVFGWNTAVWVTDIFVLLSITFCYRLVSDSMTGIICLGLASVIAISGQLYAHLTRQKVESNASFPIASSVRSFILWHLAVVVTFQPDLMLGIVIFYLMFEIALRLRPEKSQI